MVNFTDRNLTTKSVSENLNILDYETFFFMTKLILKNNIPDLLIAYDNLIRKGFDELQFIVGLGSHFRDLLVSKETKTLSLLEVSESIREKYRKQTLSAPISLLLKGIDLLSKCELDYRNTINKRLLIELCIMQIASLHSEEK